MFTPRHLRAPWPLRRHAGMKGSRTEQRTRGEQEANYSFMKPPASIILILALLGLSACSSVKTGSAKGVVILCGHERELDYSELAYPVDPVLSLDVWAVITDPLIIDEIFVFADAIPEPSRDEFIVSSASLVGLYVWDKESNAMQRVIMICEGRITSVFADSWYDDGSGSDFYSKRYRTTTDNDLRLRVIKLLAEHGSSTETLPRSLKRKMRGKRLIDFIADPEEFRFRKNLLQEEIQEPISK